MTELSGVEREDAPALNNGDTEVDGVAEAEWFALELLRVTGMEGSHRDGGWEKRDKFWL